MSEILSYEKFVENLRAYLLDALNLQEERIYFKVKDEAGMTPEGDRLFVECNVSPEGKEVCGIHTEELYEDYLDGISIKRIGDTVTDEILKLKDAGFFKKVQDVNRSGWHSLCFVYESWTEGWMYLQHENPQIQSGRLGNG